MTKWIDVSDLLKWRGTFTGIQRVTFEYAVRLERDGAKLFAYDAGEDRFFEVDFSLVREQSEKAESVLAPRVSLRGRIRRVVSAPYRHLSDNSRTFLQPYAAAVNHTVRTVIHQFTKTKAYRSHARSLSEYHSYPEATFKENDLIVLLGAGWNTSTLLNRLISIKQETDIRICQHINDILPIYQPQLFADELPKIFENYVSIAVKNADIITVISLATKRDIEAYCEEHDIETPRISVVRLGDNPDVADAPLKPQMPDIDSFLLAVGTFEVRKNYFLLYQAIKLAQTEQREIPPIVIAGRPGWLSADLRHMIRHDPYAASRIIWLKDVSDAELKWLYEHCMFTIFPSIAEGWGLPIAESLQHGKTCLTSGLSSMLEIGSGLVDYFLPYDPRECVEKIRYYVAEDRYKITNKKVREEYQVFTWDESYAQLRLALEN